MQQMLQRLKNRMKEEGLSDADVASAIGGSATMLSLKLNEMVGITLDEARSIRDRFFPEESLGRLLQSDGDVPALSDLERERDGLRMVRGIAPELDEPMRSALDEVVGEGIDALNAEIDRRARQEGV